jgi:signal peptidase II
MELKASFLTAHGGSQQYSGIKQYIFWTLPIIVFADQIIKWLARSRDWDYVINPGVAFSLGFQWPWIDVLVWGAFLLLVIRIKHEVLSIKNCEKISNTKYKILNTFALVLFLSGGISNIIDRFFFGGVIDYIKIWQFPIFNLADAAICFGVILLLIPMTGSWFILRKWMTRR